MPRGRSPEGGTALSNNAERQARYRDRHKQVPVVVVQSRKPVDRRPRPQRWHDAVTELLVLQAAYTAWFEGLPESLRGTATANALEAIVELDLDTLAAITPPRGYGRD
jgi:hypothetical protein